MHEEERHSRESDRARQPKREKDTEQQHGHQRVERDVHDVMTQHLGAEALPRERVEQHRDRGEVVAFIDAELCGSKNDARLASVSVCSGSLSRTIEMSSEIQTPRSAAAKSKRPSRKYANQIPAEISSSGGRRRVAIDAAEHIAAVRTRHPHERGRGSRVARVFPDRRGARRGREPMRAS